jgi:hypothetical protein
MVAEGSKQILIMESTPLNDLQGSNPEQVQSGNSDEGSNPEQVQSGNSDEGSNPPQGTNPVTFQSSNSEEGSNPIDEEQGSNPSLSSNSDDGEDESSRSPSNLGPPVQAISGDSEIFIRRPLDNRQKPSPMKKLFDFTKIELILEGGNNSTTSVSTTRAHTSRADSLIRLYKNRVDIGGWEQLNYISFNYRFNSLYITAMGGNQ